uniref:Leucine rich repeat containing 32 n=1 Tax=Myripristis murdjan TaxID=586833 RepID=A0A667XQY8_9TELE
MSCFYRGGSLMDVFCSNRSLRCAPANLSHGIQTLDLSRNMLQNLTLETLAFHTSLHNLNLHSNKIQFIQPDLFKDMTNLKVLDLSRNYLDVFALTKTYIGPLPAVESLDLSSNGLYTGMTDYFLSHSPLLENLSLSGNSITKIAKNTFNGSLGLRGINLHNNVILEIEDGAFDSLHNLTELDLSKNSITCITDFNLSKLKVLNLSKNSMETFQTADSDIEYDLLYLDLSENRIPYFPLLPRRNKIVYLDVSRNQLYSVNVTGPAEELAILGHSSSNLRTRHQLLSNLVYLDLSYNQLKSIPLSFICSMLSLEVLNVSNNCISSFYVEDLLPQVRVLDLSYNSLQNFSLGENTLQLLEDSVQNKTKPLLRDENHLLKVVPANAFYNTPLKLLDLSLNPGLEMDPNSLSGLENSLVHLFLRENNISKLMTDLSLLNHLKFVDLSTNQLTTLPLWNKESSIESLNLQNNNLVSFNRCSLHFNFLSCVPLSCLCDCILFYTKK